MKYFFVIVFLALTIPMAAQQALDFDEARKSGQFSRLEKEYPNALEIFKSEEDSNKLMQSWKTFFADLGRFLSEKGYKWKEQTRCFNRIYMGPSIPNLCVVIYSCKCCWKSFSFSGSSVLK